MGEERGSYDWISYVRDELVVVRRSASLQMISAIFQDQYTRKPNGFASMGLLSSLQPLVDCPQLVSPLALTLGLLIHPRELGEL